MIVKYVDDTGPHHTNAVEGIVSDKEWTLVQGIVNIKATGTLSVDKLFVEGPKAGVDFYVDDVSLKLLAGNGARAAIGPTLVEYFDKDAKALPKEEKENHYGF